MKDKSTASKSKVVSIEKHTNAKREKTINSTFTSIVKKADELCEQHQQFHTQYIVRTNAELYKLLSSIYDLYLHAQQLPQLPALMNKLRKHMRQKHSIKLTTKSSTASILVRYIVRTDRKTAHLYSRAIQTAANDHVKPEDLPDYICSKGGVERIRKAAVNSENSKKLRLHAQVMHDALVRTLKHRAEINPIGVLHRTQKKSRAMGINGVEFEMFLGTRGRDGETKIVASIYPCTESYKKLLQVYLTALISAQPNPSSNEFHEYCNKHGLLPDQAINWAQQNGFETHEKVVDFYSTIRAVAKEYLVAHKANKFIDTAKNSEINKFIRKQLLLEQAYLSAA